MERGRLTCLPGITFVGRACKQRPDGTGRLVVGSLPVEPVVLPFGAEELAGVVLHRFVIVRDGGILLLGIDQRFQDFDGAVLVIADAPVEDLLDSILGVEVPCPPVFFTSEMGMGQLSAPI